MKKLSAGHETNSSFDDGFLESVGPPGLERELTSLDSRGADDLRGDGPYVYNRSFLLTFLGKKVSTSSTPATTCSDSEGALASDDIALLEPLGGFELLLELLDPAKSTPPSRKDRHLHECTPSESSAVRTSFNTSPKWTTISLEDGTIYNPSESLEGLPLTSNSMDSMAAALPSLDPKNDGMRAEASVFVPMSSASAECRSSAKAECVDLEKHASAIGAQRLVGTLEHLSLVWQHIEHYFNSATLFCDPYLCSLMDESGWVQLADIVQLPELMALGVDVSTAAQAINNSVSVELSYDGLCARAMSEQAWDYFACAFPWTRVPFTSGSAFTGADSGDAAELAAYAPDRRNSAPNKRGKKCASTSSTTKRGVGSLEHVASQSIDLQTSGKIAHKVQDKNSFCPFKSVECVVVELPPTCGSVGHPNNCGPPCKYAKKARGCKDAALCSHCHLCVYKAVRTNGNKNRHDSTAVASNDTSE